MKVNFFFRSVALSLVMLVNLSYLQAQTSIAIFTYTTPGMSAWDSSSVKKGITGSEEAVIYISEKLVDLGYRVIVFGNPPEDSPQSLKDANPRFVKTDYNDEEKFDIAISWRMPWAAQILQKRASHVFLWPHDTWDQPLQPEQINSFDGVLWISQWQREQWVSINPLFAKFTRISGNGINPEEYKEPEERKNPHSCIYGSNYARGLENLLFIWPQIKQEFPKASLDIYYGWQTWGLLTAEQENRMKAQIEDLKALDVREHGLVGHKTLIKAYEEASLWTYPCTALEVFCITAIRAQYAGAIPVIINGSALPETVRHGFKCSQASDYSKTLCEALRKAESVTLAERKKMRSFILEEFTWQIIAKKWKEQFDQLQPGIASTLNVKA